MFRTRFAFSILLRSSAVFAGLLLAGCGSDDDDASTTSGVGALQPGGGDAVNAVLAALGGKQALAELKGFQYDSTGSRYVLNEGLTPEDVTQVNTYESARYIAISGDQLRIDTERKLTFIGVTADNQYSEIVDGNAGFLQGDEGLAAGFAAADSALTPARVAAVKKQQMLLNPQILLAKVARGELAATAPGVELVGGQLQRTFEIAGVRFFSDAATGAVTKVSVLEDVSPFKDAQVEAVFDGWQQGSGTDVMFPTLAAMSAAGERVLVESRGITSAISELDATKFALPGPGAAFSQAEAARGAESQAALSLPQSLGIPFRDALQTTVAAAELAPGVWHLTGGSHNSLIVEQEAGYVLVEAPLDPFRTLAVTNWAADQLGGKPLAYVINTHHHEDHSAGVRQAVGLGARLVAHQAGAGFWQRVLNAPATVIADSLSGSAPRTTVEYVKAGESLVLPDATNPVTAYSVANCHANDMLVIGVGTFMFTSDLVSPGNGQPLCPLSQTLGALAAYNFNPETIVGGHGTTALAADLLAQYPD
ncbi:MAG TPA: MBL fold metallo-hydrolase [Polyangiaceae bacterium]|nr:MBL fold metallo-hydrolase [Polyangiaceae bacterium]